MFERVAHAFGSRNLARMRCDAETGVASDVESPGKIRMRAYALVTAHAETGYGRMRAACRKAGNIDCGLGVEMAHACDDQSTLDAVAFICPADSFSKAVHVGFRGKTGDARVIGRNEHLAVDCALIGNRFEIGLRKERVILLGSEQGGGGIVRGKETAEIGPNETRAVDKPIDIDTVFPRPAT